MTTIFISGSREIAYVPDEVKERVDRIVNSGFDIVVGDSERGVDAAVLRYLESCSYENVTVFTIHDSESSESCGSVTYRELRKCAPVMSKWRSTLAVLGHFSSSRRTLNR